MQKLSTKLKNSKLIDAAKILEAHYVPLPTIKLDDGTYLSWTDLLIALFCVILWMLISIVIMSILFQWITISDHITTPLSAIEVCFAVFLFIKVFKEPI